jgi:hypothetical protein
MRKAKIILSAIAVFAVIAGAFAFNANKFLPSDIYSSYKTIVGFNQTILCSLTNLHATVVGGFATTTYTTAPNHICGPLVSTRATMPND